MGGRRIAGAHTQTVEVEDIAALYQAHRGIAKAYAHLDQVLQEVSQPLINAFKAMVDLYNRNVRQYNQSNIATFSSRESAEAVAAVKHHLDLTLPASPRQNTPLTDSAWQFSESLLYTKIDAQRRAIEDLDPKVERRVEEIQRNRYKALVTAGELPPAEPGFSLDPQWDVTSLLRDLTQLLKDPAAIVRPALRLAAAAATQDVDEAARRRILTTASTMAWVFRDTDLRTYRLTDPWRQAIETIVSGLHGRSGLEAEERALVPFLRLQKELKAAKGEAAQQLQATLMHLESLHWAQCARYDGARQGTIQGTRVGMNLFYTDILAKLWASVDYYRQAPIEAIYGFRSEPVDGLALEPLYWDETWKFPNTRLWFGPKGDAYKGDPGEGAGLNFAHISTRVYSAGSDPLRPGEETTPAEPSRRVFNWWDRHFVKVADYEPAYHLQNQIMKWSVITGWMAAHESLRTLEEIPVNRSYRFDHWYRTSNDLKFHEALPFLPAERWLGGTECVEILRSYPFPIAGSLSAFIEGGVSLGSSKSLKAASRIQHEIPPALRRGTLDYSVSKPSHAADLKLANLKKTTFEFPPARQKQASVKMTFPETARSRVGPTEMRVKALKTEIALEGGQGRITLETERGAMGGLHFESTDNGVRLLWRDGHIEADRVVLEDIGHLFRGEESAASRLATRQPFLPRQGGYIIEGDAQGVEVVRLPGAGAGGGSRPPPPSAPPPPAAPPGGDGGASGGPGSPPPRVFRVAAGGPDGDDGNAYLHTSNRSRLWMLLGLDDSVKVKIEASILDEAQAFERVNGNHWQRLRPVPSDTGQLPGNVERVFTNRGPSDAARPVKIQTHDPELGTLNGFVEQDVLFLARPQPREFSQPFNDFVVNEGINSPYIAEVITAGLHAAPDAMHTAPPALSVGAVRGMRAASHAAVGDYAAAITELSTAARASHLRSAVESYTRQLPRELLSKLSEGEYSSTAAGFAGRRISGEAADSQLVRALAALRRRQPHEARDGLEAAFDGAKSSPSATAAVGESLDHVASPAVRDYARIRHGEIDGLSAELANHVQLQPADFVLLTTLEKSRLQGGKLLSRAEQADLATRFRDELPPAIYVEDSKLLNKLDWDGAPGPSLNEIAKNPDVAWERVNMADLGGFRPSMLFEDTRRFVRRDIPQPTARDLSSTSTAEQVLRPLRFRSLYIARSCDENNDGQVSEEERARCVHE